MSATSTLIKKPLRVIQLKAKSGETMSTLISQEEYISLKQNEFGRIIKKLGLESEADIVELIEEVS